jgi:hypothetical protein
MKNRKSTVDVLNNKIEIKRRILMDKRYEDVKSFFNYWLKDIRFDKSLLNRLTTFRLQWSTKSDDYIDFLGSNLIGVHEIRFSSIDDKNLLEIFEIDDLDTIQKDFYKVKGIK